MIYTTPDYYKEFKCTADKCEDTCCAGWQIVIDKKSMEKYRKMQGEYVYKILAGVDWENKVFRQDKEKRCAFLNRDNLCDLYANMGEKSLCRTCRLYPRHVEEFEGVREMTLSISCPEAARMLMERKTPVTFVSREAEGEENYQDFDPFLFSILQDARKEMITIIQNREISLQERTMLILGMAHDIQGRINRQEMFACSSVIKKYTTEKAYTFVKNRLMHKNIAKEEEVLLREMFAKLYDLELLREDWGKVLHETRSMLFFATKETYAEHRQAFEAWKASNPDIDIHLEQLLVYFLFTYFPGAVYDGEVFAKAQMAVYCVWMIEALWIGRWILNGRTIQIEEMTELVYRFSREVEHSDENLKRVEKMMEKKWLM